MNDLVTTNDGGSVLPYLIYAGVGLLTLLILGFIVARLYKRASKEIGFVRTGFGAPNSCKRCSRCRPPIWR